MYSLEEIKRFAFDWLRPALDILSGSEPSARMSALDEIAFTNWRWTAPGLDELVRSQSLDDPLFAERLLHALFAIDPRQAIDAALHLHDSGEAPYDAIAQIFLAGVPPRLHDRVDNNTQDVKSDKQIQNIIRFRQEVKRRYVNTARKNKNEFVLLAAKTFLVSSAVIFGASILYDVIFGSGKLNTDSTDQTSNSLSMR